MLSANELAEIFACVLFLFCRCCYCCLLSFFGYFTPVDRTKTGGRLTSWLFTKRGGVEFGATEYKSIQWQGGEDLNPDLQIANTAP